MDFLEANLHWISLPGVKKLNGLVTKKDFAACFIPYRVLEDR